MFWQYLQDTFGVRPRETVNLIFYDGRKDFIENLPHPSLPLHIDAVILHNRIHFVLEKRMPVINEMVLFHELVHIFQKQIYTSHAQNLWFSDIQAEYLLWNFFWGPELGTSMRKNLTFSPQIVRDRMQRETGWRYNWSLGLVVIEYLLHRYSLKEQAMGQLAYLLQQDRLLTNHLLILDDALSFMESKANTYSFLSDSEHIKPLPFLQGSIPSSHIFSQDHDIFLIHLLRRSYEDQPDTFHDLAILIPSEGIHFLTGENQYYDWPSWGSRGEYFYVTRTNGLYSINQESIEEQETRTLYQSKDYLGNLFYHSASEYLFFTQDHGPHRNLYSLDPAGTVLQHTEGSWEDWSPYVKNETLFFLSNREKQYFSGGDLYSLSLETGSITRLSQDFPLTAITDMEGEKVLMTATGPSGLYSSLYLLDLSTEQWQQIETAVPIPYFPHLKNGEIQYWKTH